MDYNKLIDHTLLKPDCVDADIEKLCKEAREYIKAKHLKGYTVYLCRVCNK